MKIFDKKTMGAENLNFVFKFFQIRDFQPQFVFLEENFSARRNLKFGGNFPSPAPSPCHDALWLSVPLFACLSRAALPYSESYKPISMRFCTFDRLRREKLNDILSESKSDERFPHIK